jgi:hypothetical protein
VAATIASTLARTTSALRQSATLAAATHPLHRRACGAHSAAVDSARSQVDCDGLLKHEGKHEIVDNSANNPACAHDFRCRVHLKNDVGDHYEAGQGKEQVTQPIAAALTKKKVIDDRQMQQQKSGERPEIYDATQIVEKTTPTTRDTQATKSVLT